LYRFERKFHAHKFEELMSIDSYILSNNFIVFQKPFKSRLINNVYFDDFENSSLYENTDGLLMKKKIRLRWYDDNLRSLRFEIKGKNGDYGSKKVWKIKLKKMDYKTLISLLKDYDLFLKFLNKLDVDPGLKYIFNCINPVSFNNYHREYFIDLYEKVRMTIDSNLIFKNWRAGINDLNHDLPQLKVFEFKYSSDDYKSSQLFEAFIKQFPVKISKFSKFAYSSYSEELNK
jgi:hypothetical protein